MQELIKNAVEMKDGKAVTTSLKIAEVFGKRHCDVIRSIERLEIPDNVSKRNFAFTSIPVSQPNGGTRQSPVYLITRDGFTLLAMGFTGAKAMRFKIAYIEAFNRMEATLTGLSRLFGPVPSDTMFEKLIDQISENERLRARLEIAQHFMPLGKPGDLNEKGIPKTQFRRGYYVGGKGRSISALIEHPNLPGLFEEVKLRSIDA